MFTQVLFVAGNHDNYYLWVPFLPLHYLRAWFSLGWNKNMNFEFLKWKLVNCDFFENGLIKNNSLFTNLKNHNSLIPQPSIKSLNSYFLLHSHENQAQVMGWQGWDSIFIHSYILDSYLPNLRNPSNIMISPVTKVSNTTNAGSLLAYSAVNRDLINSS